MAQNTIRELDGERCLKESTLQLRPKEQFTFSRYRIGLNQQLFDCLSSPENLWLFGPPSIGKTHLAHALVSTSKNAILVDDPTYNLNGLDRFSLIVFDDIKQWIGERSVEAQLVGLYEQLSVFNGRIVVTSRFGVNETQFAVADLESRMRLFSRYELLPLPSEERIELFCDLAADRGIEISREIVEYLRTRIGRSQGDLLRALEILDDESIVKQRRITIPFIKQALQL